MWREVSKSQWPIRRSTMVKQNNDSTVISRNFPATGTYLGPISRPPVMFSRGSEIQAQSLSSKSTQPPKFIAEGT